MIHTGMLTVKNAQIKEAIALEQRDKLIGAATQEAAQKMATYTMDQKGMNILLSYIEQLCEIAQKFKIDFDLQYKNMGRVLDAIAYEFAVGQNSGYALIKNLEVVQKTLAAYFTWLAANEHDCKILVSAPIAQAQPALIDPESWGGCVITVRNATKSYNLLTAVQSCASFQKNVLRLELEPLLMVYEALTGKDLVEYGIDTVEYEL